MPKVEFSLKNRCVLVIDDNELVRQSLKNMYESCGSIVYASGQLEKSVTVLRGLVSAKNPPALILVEIKLADCYGLKALRHIRQVLGDNQVPIVVVSNGFNKNAIQEMRLYGVLAYVEKPLLIDKLYRFTMDLLESYFSHEAVPAVPLQKAG